jgi:hypothetical protein
MLSLYGEALKRTQIATSKICSFLHNKYYRGKASMQQTKTNQNTGRLQPRLRTALSLTLALATLASGSEALACASCGCSLSTDWGSQGVSTALGFSGDLSYTYINQSTPIYGNTKNPSAAFLSNLYANGQEIELSTKTQTITAAINYNSDTWGIGVQIPYLNRTHATDGSLQPGDTATTAPLGTYYATSSDSGIGDVRVVGRYSGFSEARTTGLIAGIKLPTGSTNANFSGGAGPLDSGLQLGTGSTDIIYGAFTSGLISTYGWFVQGTVQHAISGFKTEATGTYRPGDTFSLNTGIRYAGFGATVTPMLQLNLVHRNSDEGTSVNNDVLTGAPISSGTLAYLAPGVSVRVGGGTSIYGFVQLPIYQNVGSLQLVPQYTATVGVHHTF